MKKTVFKGAATAMITPLTESGIDYNAFGKFIDWQVAEGIDAVVVCGTTGEASTLTDDEHKEAIRFAIDRVDGKIPVIAGTGSNDTDYALELTRFACGAGADGVLVVTPYYNKATQNGLIKMFSVIADAATKPVMLYNVPSRTGVNILPATVAKLAEHPNICGIKEASGNISQAAEIMALAGDKIDMYSGNDDQTVPIMSLGGVGCISVLSNPLPRLTAKMCHLMLEGNVAEARKIQLDTLALTNALFSEVNPIPVKAAMAAMGYCENFLRLPLTVMEEPHRQVLIAEMRKMGIGV